MKNVKDNRYTQEILSEILDSKWFGNYYSPLEVIKNNTPYTLTFGGRDLGKTYAWTIAMLAIWQYKGKRSVLLRRMADTLKPSKAGGFFDKVFKSGIIKNVKEYDGITYRTGKWCGFWIDEKGKKTYDEPFCYSFALSSKIEMNKGISDIEDLAIVFFDEALTADNYLPDEWSRFLNAVSTLIRDNSTAMVVLSANTVSWVAPYFREFGIKDPKKIKQGTIEIVQGMGDTAVTVEYCKDTLGSREKKIVDKRFFGFGGGTSKMIRTGGWEVHSYQHLTRDMLDGRDIDLISRDLYIAYENEILCLELYELEDFGLLVNVRPARDFEKGIRIYCIDDHTDPRYQYRPDSKDKLDLLIWGLYKRNRFYYADNMCGETVYKYLQEVKML